MSIYCIPETVLRGLSDLTTSFQGEEQMFPLSGRETKAQRLNDFPNVTLGVSGG